MHSKILQSNGGSLKNVPQNFVQKIPDPSYNLVKRNSVFHKVDVNQLTLEGAQVFKKSKKELSEILPLLNQNFLTKNLRPEELELIAGLMIP